MILEDITFWLSLLTFLFGVLTLLGVFLFGSRTFQELYGMYSSRYEELVLLSEKSPRFREAAQMAFDSLRDYRERRNEFWTTYGQISLSIFVATVITVLLLTKTIDPDAGLPILSGVAGFAIAKTVGSTKTVHDRAPRREE